MKYKVTNKTFSPINYNGVDIIPARESVVLLEISKGLKAMQKNGRIEIKEIKEPVALKDKKSTTNTKEK